MLSAMTCRWSARELDPATRQTLIACLMGIVPVPLVMPWGCVIDRYAREPGAPWRKPPVATVNENPRPDAATQPGRAH
jgi:hypothetical protein